MQWRERHLPGVVCDTSREMSHNLQGVETKTLLLPPVPRDSIFDLFIYRRPLQTTKYPVGDLFFAQYSFLLSRFFAQNFMFPLFLIFYIFISHSNVSQSTTARRLSLLSRWIAKNNMKTVKMN
jgi:hypothetical protein